LCSLSAPPDQVLVTAATVEAAFDALAAFVGSPWWHKYPQAVRS
jgi:hypothetical protein